jgi:hypothetical protein
MITAFVELLTNVELFQITFAPSVIEVVSLVCVLASDKLKSRILLEFTPEPPAFLRAAVPV